LLFLIITFAARITRSQLTSFESTTAPSVSSVHDPEYAVSVVPAGTPVLLEPGQLPPPLPPLPLEELELEELELELLEVLELEVLAPPAPLDDALLDDVLPLVLEEALVHPPGFFRHLSELSSEVVVSSPEPASEQPEDTAVTRAQNEASRVVFLRVRFPMRCR
jgi:hypothetical protein